MKFDFGKGIVPIILVLMAVSVAPLVFDSIFGVENDVYEFDFSTSGFSYDDASLINDSPVDSVIGNGFFLSQDVNVSSVSFYCGSVGGIGLVDDLYFYPTNMFYNESGNSPVIPLIDSVSCSDANFRGVVSVPFDSPVELSGGYYYSTVVLYGDSFGSYAYELNVSDGNSTSVTDGLVTFDGGSFGSSSDVANGIEPGVVYSLYDIDYSVNERGSYTPAWFSLLLYLIAGVFFVVFLLRSSRVSD